MKINTKDIMKMYLLDSHGIYFRSHKKWLQMPCRRVFIFFFFLEYGKV